MRTEVSPVRYVVLAIWFAIAITFQLAVSIETLVWVWSDAQKVHPAGLVPWTMVLVLHVLNPLACLIFGFYVASVRTWDARAWLMLAFLWSFSVLSDGSNYPDDAMRWQVPFNHLGLVYRTAGMNLWPVCMLLFALYFPERADFDRRRPFVKWLFLVPALLGCLTAVASRIARNERPSLNASLGPSEVMLIRFFFWCSIAIFLAIMARKLVVAQAADERRRLRVLAIGLTVSFVPQFITDASAHMMHMREEAFPFWLTIPVIALLLLFPLTLAYVTVVQRALDVRVILRQGLQYAMARRGVLFLQIAISAFVIALVALFSGRLPFPGRIGLTAAGLGAILLVGSGAQRLAQWVDRRFFREAYNAEQLLARLVESISSLVELSPLLTTVTTRTAEALHITEMAVFLSERDMYRPAYALGYREPPQVEFLNTSLTVVELQRTGRALPVYHDDPRSWVSRIGAHELAELQRLGTQLLLPLGRRKELLGFLSLGRRYAEAPYTSRDMQLLESVAQQTALAVENSHLTSTVAAEAAEREVIRRELSIAREVQQRLLPQASPQMAGISCYGFCRPAREVGGDYYDFLELQNQSLGIAIGDVAGKGIPASLLMASLQASLRGQTMSASGDLRKLMSNVNQLVYGASPVNRYATFFYAQYDVALRRLSYVNAGHNAPLLLRGQDGAASVTRLEAGGPPLGMLPHSSYESDTVELRAGDLLVLFTDGVTEAMNTAEEEWGEENLVATLQRSACREPRQLVEAVFESADSSAANAPQHDDMTLVVLSIGS